MTAKPSVQQLFRRMWMEIDAFLADSVAVAEGKLYAQGVGWNVIHTAFLPVRHDRIGIGAIVRVPYTATNQKHSFSIYLIGSSNNDPLPLADAPPGVETLDGKIRRLGGQFNVGRPPTVQPGDEQLVPVGINIDGLEFDEADSYQFVIELDGTKVKELRFRISQVIQPAPVFQ
jgi:hypothetical protein